MDAPQRRKVERSTCSWQCSTAPSTAPIAATSFPIALPLLNLSPPPLPLGVPPFVTVVVDELALLLGRLFLLWLGSAAAAAARSKPTAVSKELARARLASVEVEEAIDGTEPRAFPYASWSSVT